MARKQIDPERRAEIGRQRRAQTRAKILAAAFEIFGDENGLFARIEDVVAKAGITRATFYNHFTGMAELREALIHEVTHDFLVSVTNTIARMPDPRDRAAVALRCFLHRARQDKRWAWSMLNISASGVTFGSETYRQAEQTVTEGIEAGAFPITSIDLGRDILLGSSLAALASMIRLDNLPDDYPEAIAGSILVALGVPQDEAHQIAHQPIPELLAPQD
ncbi:TetR/AcrR family transcriptional regulator [Aurantiacibacter xanthus]|uniref:TetR/AcrR family transcriptional regulator n=1 Tax=Aurantiacibacter xanthus TaxID=1784712 RepID=UPI00174B8AC4|nr:TetR/AcrR family transcriptional regulator [Aurantiacibacter xanthus]